MEDPGWTIIEATPFMARRDRYFRSDEEYAAFQSRLRLNPEAGDVIPGAGGIRKIRWEDARRGKGKRGGLRIAYLNVPEREEIYLWWVYSKDEADDLSADVKKALRAAADAIRTEARRSRKK